MKLSERIIERAYELGFDLVGIAPADVEIRHGSPGQFDVSFDGKVVFSKADTGRFPSDAEIDALPVR